MTHFTHLSLTALRLELRSVTGLSIGVATGTVWVQGTNYALVSNWHVLAGRNNRTGQPRHASGAVPHSVTFPVKRPDAYIWDMVTLPLMDGDTPRWRQHPAGQSIDLAWLPISPSTTIDRAIALPTQTNSNELALLAGLDAYVLGFPLGMNKQDYMPIWKRASIASEPLGSVDGLEIILVDTATREGMSGAPAFLWQTGAQLIQEKPGVVHTRIGGAAERLLGIYSGRYGADDEFGAQLGRVWKSSLVEQMLNQVIPGHFELSAV